MRDVNHPSILFWDNGNEGGFNTNFDHLFPAYDPQQRRVLKRTPWASFICGNLLHDALSRLRQGANRHGTGKSRFFTIQNQEVVATNDPTKYIYMPTEFSARAV